MLFPNNVHFSEQPANTLDGLISSMQPDTVALLVDENTMLHCLPLLNVSAPVITIESGETKKSIETCVEIWDQMTKIGMSRKSLLINLGGGVIGDMGGFAASTFKRGIRFINIPTTLLSMADASIGGKLGVDFRGFKNHIGLFQHPEAILVSDTFLLTLPERQLISGFAEVLKYGLIHDKDYWTLLSSLDLTHSKWDEFIKKSISIKHQIVSEDPLEKEIRKVLNFGHTMGHAIESYFLESDEPLLHGEAIAIGMLLEAQISVQNNFLEVQELQEIKEVIQRYFDLRQLPDLKTLQHWLSHDKKKESGVLNFSLLMGIGKCAFDQPVGSGQLEKCLNYYAAVR